MRARCLRPPFGRRRTFGRVGDAEIEDLVVAEEADAAFNHLGKQGLIVRQVGGYGLPECLRITVGTEDNCRAVIAALTSFKAAA